VGGNKHIHLDAVGGIAGDMFIASILDALPELQTQVWKDLSAVLPDEAGIPMLRSTNNGGFPAKHFELNLENKARESAQVISTYIGFRDRIARTTLSSGTASRAKEILLLIARAEAEVHGCSIDHVHFHELADWDTLADIVAAASIITGLSDVSWSLSPLPLGGGLIRSAHGLLPNPAPASARILLGYDWHDDGIAGERVTPTGAAIACHITGGKGNGTRPAGLLEAIGTGAGSRALVGAPNILRATIFDVEARQLETITLLSFDIDDMTGEEIATAANKLRNSDGVLDLILTPALGKKGRTVTRVEIQSELSRADEVVKLVFLETSTLGVRRQNIFRHILNRQSEVLAEGIRKKSAHRPDGSLSAKVEQDDIEEISGLAARRSIARRAEQ